MHPKVITIYIKIIPVYGIYSPALLTSYGGSPVEVVHRVKYAL